MFWWVWNIFGWLWWDPFEVTNKNIGSSRIHIIMISISVSLLHLFASTVLTQIRLKQPPIKKRVSVKWRRDGYNVLSSIENVCLWLLLFLNGYNVCPVPLEDLHTPIYSVYLCVTWKKNMKYIAVKIKIGLNKNY